MHVNPIAIVDDDESVRDSLSILLDAHGYQSLTFCDGEAFLDNINKNEWLGVFLDIRMPGRDGMEILQILRQKVPDLPVIMISAHADVSTAVRAIKIGAIDFFEKPFQADEVVTLVEKLNQKVRERSRKTSEQETARAALGKLTKRENEVAIGMSNGLANKAIAFELGISIRTVETHRAHLMRKLDIRSVSELVRLILLAGNTAT